MKTKPPITPERLASAEHYRAQVQLNNPLVWAILYQAVVQYSPATSGQLRELLSPAMEDIIVRHVRTRLKDPTFKAYLRSWMASNVAPEAVPAVDLFLKATLPEVVA